MLVELIVRVWVFDDVDGFVVQYVCVREIGYECLVDELLEIVDILKRGIKIKINEKGEVEISEGDMIEYCCLQVDVCKWMFVKMFFKKYGDWQVIVGDLDVFLKYDYIVSL